MVLRIQGIDPSAFASYDRSALQSPPPVIRPTPIQALDISSFNKILAERNDAITKLMSQIQEDVDNFRKSRTAMLKAKDMEIAERDEQMVALAHLTKSVLDQQKGEILRLKQKLLDYNQQIAEKDCVIEKQGEQIAAFTELITVAAMRSG